MSVTGVAVVLGLALLVLVQLRALRLGPALLCAVFGLVIGMSAAGPAVHDVLDASGAWLWSTVTQL